MTSLRTFKALFMHTAIKSIYLMNRHHNLICALAAAALLPASLSAQEQTREVRGLNTARAPRHTAVRRAPSNASYETTLVGFLYYADSWNNLDDTTPLGIYTIGSEPGSMPQPFARIGDMNSLCNGGAVLAGDKYWYIWRQTEPTGTVDISQLYSYDIATGDFQAYGIVSSALASASDKSWDPTEDKIYGQYTVNGKRKLCIVDYEEQTVTPVGDCYSYYGLAFDASGQLWGIDSAGDLYKVDKRNGKASKVGSTGITPKYSQTMTFDHKTGELFWASYTDGSRSCSNLYKVDTTDASLTLVTAFEDEEEFMGLGVMPPLAADNAPGYATGLSVATQGASYTADISFSLPAYTYMGDALSGTVDYRVLANGNTILEDSGKAGGLVTKNVTLPAGDVQVSVICANSEGDGPAALFGLWVGDDYPQTPRGLTLDLDEDTGLFSLSWQPVTQGAHGGFIDTEKISYTVVRYPGAKTVASNLKATSFSETLECPDLPVDHYYEVTALHDWRESENPAESNHVPFGKGFEVPYFNNFDTSSSLNLFYKIDGNGDGSTWKWNGFGTKTAYIFTGTDFDKPQDDWLITPGINMKAGNRYQISYTVAENMNTGRFTDMMETAFGTGVNPATYTTAEELFICRPGQADRRSVIIIPETDCYYHFGFHALSDAIKGLSIAIEDLNIDVLANDGAPAAVSGLKAKTSDGTAPVTITFTTPSKNIKGETISEITKIDVFRNTNELIKSIESPAPATPLTVVDNKGARGLTKYTVVAYNNEGIGDRADVEVYLGLDLPGAPLDVTLTDEGKGLLKLSWKAPKEGAHGGFCDRNNLSYNIYVVDNGNFATFQTDIKSTEISINAEDYYASEQYLTILGVAAVNSLGEGYVRQSSEVIIGNPYSYPFSESWPYGNESFDMWYRMNSGANGWLPTANHSSDNDNGCIEFDAAADLDMSYICLGKIDMTTAVNPKLIFDYYAVPGAQMSITPEINHAFTGEYTILPAIDFSLLSGQKEWREAVVDLSQFKSLPYITVRFLGTGTTAHPLRIDNVRVMNSDKAPNLESGVANILTDDSEATYVDINGLPVSGTPARGSVLIRRSSDGSFSKIIF